MASLSRLAEEASFYQKDHPHRVTVPFVESEIEGSIPRRFEEIAHKYPDRCAIKYRGQQWTYRTLDRIANQIARAILARLGTEPAPIALLLEQGLQIPAAILGVLKAGCFYVPLDPSYPYERLIAMMDDADPRLVVTNTLNAPLARTLVPDGSNILDIDALDAQLLVESPALSIAADALAYILYTSGSTGQPKGVMQNHRNTLFDTRGISRDLGFTIEDHFGLLFSYSFSASVRYTFGSLLNGATLFPFDFREGGFAQLADWLNEEAITILDINVATFRRFAPTLPASPQFPRMRLLTLTGEPVQKTDVETYRQYFTADCLLQNLLGSGETRTLARYFIGHQTPIEESSVPVGFAAAGKQILLLDEKGNEVAPGEVGEIVVKSRYLSPGYWRKPEQTHAVFKEDPSGTGERLYFMGDIGRKRADGCLIHLGRKDSQVKIRGARVELAEVEVALKSLDGVEDAVIVARDDALGNKQLIAYLVAKSDYSSSARTLREALSQKLPSYMVPARFLFLRTLPRTPNGKVDRLALPTPMPLPSSAQEDHIPPSTPFELRLTHMWEEVLGIRPIGIKDNFFDLGGDSLLAATFLSAVEEDLKQEIPVTALFESPTVEELARRIARHEMSPDTTALVVLQRGTDRPPFFCVPGASSNTLQLLRLARHLGEDQPFFAVQLQGFEGRAVPYTSVEEIAKQAMQVIQETHPTGPYCLGGFSMGGLIALEIAQQLGAKGEDVTLLALLDTAFPGTQRLSFREGKPAWVAFPAHEPAALDLTNQLQHGWQGINAATTRFWLSLGRLSRMLRYRLYLRSGKKIPQVLRQAVVNETHSTAAYRYTPQNYAGRITLFSAAHGRTNNKGTLYRWQQLAGGGLEIHQVPGDHDVVMEPGVTVLAERLRACLDTAAHLSKAKI